MFILGKQFLYSLCFFLQQYTNSIMKHKQYDDFSFHEFPVNFRKIFFVLLMIYSCFLYSSYTMMVILAINATLFIAVWCKIKTLMEWFTTVMVVVTIASFAHLYGSFIIEDSWSNTAHSLCMQISGQCLLPMIALYTYAVCPNHKTMAYS